MRQNIFLFEQLGNLIQGFEGGINFPPVPEGEAASEWRVLKISAVTWGEFNPYESKPINPNVVFDDSLIVRQGDLLMSRANTTELVGAVCLVRNHPPKLLLPDKIWRIKFTEKSKLLPEYALYALRSPALRKIIGDLATGSSGSMKNISMEKAATLPIPLPPLTEQKRMAAIAQKADRLRRTRRYALQLSDTFLQSVFLEMFGDPVSNPRDWETQTLDDIARKITDGEHLNPTFQFTGYPIVMAQQVEQSGVNVNECRFVSEGDFLKFTNKCKPEFNDILLVSRGATIGRSCTVNTTKAFCLMGSVILIKPDISAINPYFLSYLIKSDSYQKILKTTSGSSAQEAIYIANLRDKPIILPPLPLQEKFAQIVQKFERLRTQQREAERQAEHLFQTILHRAFRGELTSSDINEEPASDLLEQSPPKQTKPETTVKAGDTSTRDTAKNPDTKAKPQDTEAIQLKLPGFE